MNGKPMNDTTENDDIRDDYDFSGGVRGKHHRAYRQGTNLVLLEPDVAKIFKNSKAVNHALRMLMELAGNVVGRHPTEGGPRHT